MQNKLIIFRKNHMIFILILFTILLFPLLINNINLSKEKTDSTFLVEDQPKSIHIAASTYNFKYYKEIIIDHSKVGNGIHLDFPLLLDFTDQDLHNHVQADGDDIAFYSGTEWLDYEIELFDQGVTQAHLVAWVRIPSLSNSADTTIYMYYGNSTMEAQQNPSAVWNSNYKAVWHLNATMLDSTSNNNDGTNYGANDVSPFIGHSLDYNGAASNGDYSDMGSGSSIDNVFNGGATISAWIYPEGWGGGSYGRVLAKSSVTDGTDGWVLCVDGVSPATEQLIFYRGIHSTAPPADTRGLWYTGDYTIKKNQWNYVVVTYDDSVCDNYPIIYIDNLKYDYTNLTTDPAPPTTGYAQDDSSQAVYIGNYGGAAKDRTFDGVIDEVRISSGIKSSGWILTEYNNQYNPDSFYSLGSEVAIDNTPPEIIINSPTDYNLFGSLAPAFNVEVTDNGIIHTRWYRLLNGTVTTTNTTFTENGTINPVRWSEVGNGTVTLQFFANDTSGNVASSEVTLRKDINHPSITINSPGYLELFGSSPPDFNINVWDVNGVNKTWYTLDNGPIKFFTSNGTIDQSLWSTCGNGAISIKFYANDSLGNEGFSEVIVNKTISAPTIQPISPVFNDLFGTTPPNYTVEISDVKGVEDMWYTLNNGPYEFFTSNGTISQSLWDDWGNGTVSIKFYANNSLGNGDFTEVIVRKDIIGPIITINNPDDYDTFGHSPLPIYDISIDEPNGIESSWYTLDGGTTNTSFTLLNGEINQTRWDEIGNGTMTIKFYARDLVGNLGSKEVLIKKDILGPTIVINSPNPYEVFGSTAPIFNIQTIDCSGINLRWYNLENGDNITCGTSGQISPFQWSYLGNGTVSIKFYARDSLGNENFSEVIVRKDIDPPSIKVNNPISDQVYGESPPSFNVEISDNNGIDTRWYCLLNGTVTTTNTTFTTNETIDSTLWDTFGDGNINIRFYANNSIGSVSYSDVNVIKDMFAPSIDIATPNNNSYCNHPPIFNIYSYDVSFDNLWIRIGSVNISITNDNDFQLNSSIWNSLSQGLFQIHVYSNDTLGHRSTKVLNLYKDTIRPNPPTLINYPTGEVSLPLTFDWENGTDPSGIAYYRLIIDNEADPFSTPGFIFEVNITSSYYELTEFLSPRNYHFFIYCVDRAGNQGNAASGSFIIAGSAEPPSQFPWWIILIIALPLGLIIAFVALRKSKKVKVVVVDKEVEALKEQKKQLETKARSALKAGNYQDAAELYSQCRIISNQLIENGIEEEKDKFRNFDKIEKELQLKLAAIPLTFTCINHLLTAYFDQLSIKYYSNPDIYPETQNNINGLMLNDSKFLEHRLNNPENGESLINDLNIQPDTTTHINGIQFLYTNDLSEDSLIKLCEQYQNPQMLLLIVGIKWPNFEYSETMAVPRDTSIKYRDNIRVINKDLLVRLIGIQGDYKDILNEIIDLDFDYAELETLLKKIETNLYDTEELKEDLKRMEWFFFL